MASKKEPRKKSRYHISRKLGLAFDRISPTIHELDEAAYKYGEKHKKDKKNKYAHHALSNG